MTLSPDEIHFAIEALDGQLEELVTEIQDAGRKAGVAEAHFKTKFAQARLKARAQADAEGRKITTDQAEDEATVATGDERLAYLTCTNQLTVLREVNRARQAQLDAMRSLSAAHRGAGG